MPMPRTSGLAEFRGVHLEDWLIGYNLMARTYGVSDRKKAIGLIWYCSKEPVNIFGYVRELDSYERADWPALVQDLRKAFPDEKDRDRHTMRELRNIASAQSRRPMSTVADLSRYRLAFFMTAEWLQRKGHATEMELAREFVRGLPIYVRDRLLAREAIKAEARARAAAADGRPGELRNPTYMDLCAEVQRLLEGEDTYCASLVREIDEEEAEKHVTEKSLAAQRGAAQVVGSGAGSGSNSVPKNNGRNGQERAAPVVQPALIPAKMQSGGSLENAVDVLTRKMNDLSIMMSNLQSQQVHVNQAAVQAATTSAPAAVSPSMPVQRDSPPHFVSGGNAVPVGGAGAGAPYRSQQVSQPVSRGYVSRAPDRPCPVCMGGPPYHYKGQCPELRDLLDKGLCRLSTEGARLQYPDGTNVAMHPQGMKVLVLQRHEEEKRKRDSTGVKANAVELAWNPPNVSDGPRQFMTATRGELEEDSYEVQAAEKRQRNESDEGRGPAKRPQVVVEIPYKNVQRRRDQEKDAQRRPAEPLQRQREHNQDEDMAENADREEGGDGEKVKRKPASRPWSKVMDRYDQEARGIPRAILNSKLELSIGSVLALSDKLAKEMSEEFKIKRVPVPTTTWKANTVRFDTNNTRIGKAHLERCGRKVREDKASLSSNGAIYCGPTGKMLMRLQGVMVEALFDTGSEINLIPRSTFVKLGLPLIEGDLYLTDANANSKKLVGYLQNVDLTLGPMLTRQHVYVQKEAKYELLLGMPFIRSVGARTWFDSQGALWCKMKGENGAEVSVCLTDPEDPRHISHPPPGARPSPRLGDHGLPVSDTDSGYDSNATFLSTKSEEKTGGEAQDKKDDDEDDDDETVLDRFAKRPRLSTQAAEASTTLMKDYESPKSHPRCHETCPWSRGGGCPFTQFHDGPGHLRFSDAIHDKSCEAEVVITDCATGMQTIFTIPTAAKLDFWRFAQEQEETGGWEKGQGSDRFGFQWWTIKKEATGQWIDEITRLTRQRPWRNGTTRHDNHWIDSAMTGAVMLKYHLGRTPRPEEEKASQPVTFEAFVVELGEGSQEGSEDGVEETATDNEGQQDRREEAHEEDGDDEEREGDEGDEEERNEQGDYDNEDDERNDYGEDEEDSQDGAWREGSPTGWSEDPWELPSSHEPYGSGWDATRRFECNAVTCDTEDDTSADEEEAGPSTSSAKRYAQVYLYNTYDREGWLYRLKPESVSIFLDLAAEMEELGEWRTDKEAEEMDGGRKRWWFVRTKETDGWKSLLDSAAEAHDWQITSATPFKQGPKPFRSVVSFAYEEGDDWNPRRQQFTYYPAGRNYHPSLTSPENGPILPFIAPMSVPAYFSKLSRFAFTQKWDDKKILQRAEADIEQCKDGDKVKAKLEELHYEYDDVEDYFRAVRFAVQVLAEQGELSHTSCSDDKLVRMPVLDQVTPGKVMAYFGAVWRYVGLWESDFSDRDLICQSIAGIQNTEFLDWLLNENLHTLDRWGAFTSAIEDHVLEQTFRGLHMIDRPEGERPPPRETHQLFWNGERVEAEEEESAEEDEEEVPVQNGPEVFVAELDGPAGWQMSARPADQQRWKEEWMRSYKRDQRLRERAVRLREDEQGRTTWKGKGKANDELAEYDKEGNIIVDEQHRFFSATKYKPKGVKVVPVDTALPADFRNDMFRPAMSRDPNETPLTPHPPEFEFGGRLTEERLQGVEFGPEGWLWPEEKKLLLHVMRLRENALAFDENEMGRRKESYGPPTKLPLIPHVPWQENSFPTPAALRKKVIALFRKQLRAGVFEPSQAPYASKWFAILKKNGDVRLIMDSTKLNSITIRDAGVPPAVREYINDMVGYHSYFLIDLFSGYLQEPLDELSRDPTAIRTPIGLLRLTRLPIGGTNCVAIFQRRITYILQDEIPDVCMVFIDDIGGKGAPEDYGDETLPENPGIRRWLWEHAVKLERVLFRIEEAGLTASGAKLVAATPALSILGTVVNKEGREAEPKKVEKIGNWPPPDSVSAVRRFYGLYNYLRDYAPGCKDAEAVVRKKLVKRSDKFEWTEQDQAAMDEMKAALARNIRLRPIDYAEGAGKVIVSVDSSNTVAGVAVWQLDSEGKRQPVRFDSIPFNETEQRYSQPKLELAGVFKTLKKYKNDLYALPFILEVDATALVQMLRNPDLPSAAMSRWVAYIKLFDFEIVHVAGVKHVVADALSRREPLQDEPPEDFEVEDSEVAALAAELRIGKNAETTPTTFLEASVLTRAQRAARQAGRKDQEQQEETSEDETPNSEPGSSMDDTDDDERMGQGEQDKRDKDDGECTEGEEDAADAGEGGRIRERDLKHYPKEWKDLVAYLQDGERPEGLARSEWRKVLLRAVAYEVRDGRLWKRKSGIQLEVVFDPKRRDQILTMAHEDLGHRGRDLTARRVGDRFWWPKMYQDVSDHCRSCEACQFRRPAREKEKLSATSVSRLFQKVAVDLVHMGHGTGAFKYLIVARDDLSGWVEARPLRKKTADAVARFLWEDVISRMGVIGWITSDNGSEMSGAVEVLLNKYQVPLIRTAAYNPQANGMVERGHGPLVEAVLKISRGQPKKWHEHLHAALWADRLTAKRTTGYTPYELVYGAAPLLPVDAKMETWLATTWNEEMTTADLLASRIAQLERKEERLQEAAEKVRTAREKSVAYMDRKNAHKLRKPLPRGQIVLVHDTTLDKQWSRRAEDRWKGPYVVRGQLERGSYLLSELDGTRIAKPVAATRIRRFYPRGQDWTVIDQEEQDEEQEVSGIDDEELQDPTDEEEEDLAPLLLGAYNDDSDALEYELD